MNAMPNYRRIRTDQIDLGALEQLENILRLPFLRALAIMPDIHQGYGVPIGSVLATDTNVVIPNAVGVDIGCGMAAVRLGYMASNVTRDDLVALTDRIREVVPVGFNKRPVPVQDRFMPNSQIFEHTNIVAMYLQNARRQMGTLGGGNHFIEIQVDEYDYLWAMIHSGSRNLGKQVADGYNKAAKKENDRAYSKVESSWDLAFLDTRDRLGQAYMADMAYCVEYAKLNRRRMMAEVLAACDDVLPGPVGDVGVIHDICHNHVALENHLGKNVMVHRKGAAGPFYADTVGIIPGSQGTASYIVMYKDEAPPTALRTTSHGAGRALGRKAAQKSLDLQEQLKMLEGVVHQVKGREDLDEAPGAYKDIDEVMAMQSDLCVATTKLKPLAVVKG